MSDSVKPEEDRERPASDPETHPEKQDGSAPFNPNIEVQIPPALIEEYRASDKQKHRLEKKRYRIEKLTLYALVIYASVAAVQARQMIRANQFTERAVEQSKRAADAAVSANQIAERNAAASLETARQEQRAWLGPKDVRLVTLEVGKRVGAAVLITNTGRTIAKKSKLQIVLWFSPRPLNIAEFAVSKDRPSGSGPRSVSVIFPNLEMVLPVASLVPATAEDVSAIDAGRIHVYLFGELEYFDIFDRKHTTLFCGFLDNRRFAACPEYNDAN